MCLKSTFFTNYLRIIRLSKGNDIFPPEYKYFSDVFMAIEILILAIHIVFAYAMLCDLDGDIVYSKLLPKHTQNYNNKNLPVLDQSKE